MKAFLTKHGQTVVNVLLFLFLASGSVAIVTDAIQAGKFDFVVGTFFASNFILFTIVLVRRRHVAIEKGVVPQTVALGAFFSGLAFNPYPDAPLRELEIASKVVNMAAILLTTAALLNLGRSFGILVALRKVRTGGVYRIVRHPMYLGDILMRSSFVLANPSVLNGLAFAFAASCYVTRAIMEERFLSRDEEYRQYMEKVRFRFVPGIF